MFITDPTCVFYTAGNLACGKTVYPDEVAYMVDGLLHKDQAGLPRPTESFTQLVVDLLDVYQLYEVTLFFAEKFQISVKYQCAHDYPFICNSAPRVTIIHWAVL